MAPNGSGPVLGYKIYLLIYNFFDFPLLILTILICFNFTVTKRKTDQFLGLLIFVSNFPAVGCIQGRLVNRSE